LGVTLSRAERQFKNLNDGLVFPFKYDRLLDISFVWNFKLSERINISAAWAFGTGYPVTLASKRYYLESDYFNNPFQAEFHYDAINSFRMRAFHRLDFSLNHTTKTTWGDSTWSFSIFNVYNRRNPYYYFYEWDYVPTLAPPNNRRLTLKQRSLFPIFPSVSYSFKF